MTKPVYLGLSILELSKPVRYEFWYDYVKPKCGENAKLFYLDTGSFLAYLKAEDIFADITKDVEARFDTSNYELDRPLPSGKKVNGLTLTRLGFLRVVFFWRGINLTPLSYFNITSK